MNNEEDHEDMRKRLQKENEKILADFINVAVGEQKKGKRKTHQAAELLTFFADNYLTNYESENLLEGLESFPGFIGDWFIRKCMWSDEKSLRENLNAFALFLNYLKSAKTISAERIASLENELSERSSLFLLRVKYYNDSRIELEDIRTEWGDWDDEAIQALAKKDGVTANTNETVKPTKHPTTLNVHILFSAASARFFKLKPPALTSLRTWGDWDDPVHHWTSNWRSEECFSMEDTQDRVFIVSNQNTRYSFLFRLPPNNIEDFFVKFNQRLLQTLQKNGVATPRSVSFNITALSGAARSLTGFQNGQRGYLDAIIDHAEFKHLEDLEERLNHVPTKMPNHPQAHLFPDDEFTRLCAADSPFPPSPPSQNILQFPN